MSTFKEYLLESIDKIQPNADGYVTIHIKIESEHFNTMTYEDICVLIFHIQEFTISVSEDIQISDSYKNIRYSNILDVDKLTEIESIFMLFYRVYIGYQTPIKCKYNDTDCDYKIPRDFIETTKRFGVYRTYYVTEIKNLVRKKNSNNNDFKKAFIGYIRSNKSSRNV